MAEPLAVSRPVALGRGSLAIVALTGGLAFGNQASFVLVLGMLGFAAGLASLWSP